MKKIFNRIKSYLISKWGYMTKEEVQQLRDKFIHESQIIKKKNATLMLDNVALKEKLAKQPFEFDDLLQHYGTDQVNAWAYKLINHAHNNSSLNYLLERWKERIEDAQAHLQPQNNLKN